MTERDENPQIPLESVLHGLEPFEWSMEDSIAFEGALDVIGMVVASYTELIAAESRRAQPDTSAIRTWQQGMSEATAAQHSLRSTDRAEIDRVRSTYSDLLRRLGPPAGSAEPDR